VIVLDRKKVLGPFQVAAAALLWATDSPFRYPLTQKLASSVIVFAEHIVGLLLSIPILLKEYPKLYQFGRRHWVALLFISLGGSTLATLFFTFAFTLTNPTIIILLQKIQPFFAILLASLILKESISRKRVFWILALLAIVGAYFVSFGDPNYGVQLVHLFQPETYLAPFYHIGEANLLAVGLAITAAFLWGGSTVMGRVMLEKVSYPAMTGFRYLFGAIFLFIIVILTADFFSIFPVLSEGIGIGSFGEIPVYAAILYIGIIPGFLALFIYYLGLKSTKASIATLAELVFPVSAAAVNWIVLGFTLSLTQIIGTAMLLVAIMLLGLENAKE